MPQPIKSLITYIVCETVSRFDRVFLTKTQKSYPITKTFPTEGVCPVKLAIKRHEHAINTADPLALSVTQNDITKRTILLSIFNLCSQAVIISGILIALI